MPLPLNIDAELQRKLYQHVTSVCVHFRDEYIRKELPAEYVPHIKISKSILAEAVIHALVDLERMREWHMPEQTPDRHKWSGFVSKWVAKMRPVTCTFTATTAMPETVMFLNARLAVYIFQSFLTGNIPDAVKPHLRYMFYFRETRGESLALIAYCCEQMSNHS
ncbi:MAG: hypothetical protein HQL97_01150 [Magnetococcales bacterium]|nr:hypothetical protein [Magnetococcales bacterium]